MRVTLRTVPTVSAALLAVLCLGACPARARSLPTTRGHCGEWLAKPRVIVIACGDGNLYLDHLKWSGWGRRSATAKGYGHGNDCDPYCAVGHFHAHPVRVTVTRLRQCWTGQRRYTRLRYGWVSGGFTDGSVAFGCPRPLLSPLQVRLIGHNPGRHYRVVVSVRARVCGKRGRSHLRVRERLRIGGTTYARRYRRFGFEQTRRCQTKAVHWRLGDAFFGIGRYDLRVVGDDGAGASTRPRYWHQVTTD